MWEKACQRWSLLFFSEEITWINSHRSTWPQWLSPRKSHTRHKQAQRLARLTAVGLLEIPCHQLELWHFLIFYRLPRCRFIYFLSGLIPVHLSLLDSTHSLKMWHSDTEVFFFFMLFSVGFLLSSFLFSLHASSERLKEAQRLRGRCPTSCLCLQVQVWEPVIKTLTSYFQIQCSVLTIDKMHSRPCSLFHRVEVATAASEV